MERSEIKDVEKVIKSYLSDAVGNMIGVEELVLNFDEVSKSEYADLIQPIQCAISCIDELHVSAVEIEEKRKGNNIEQR